MNTRVRREALRATARVALCAVAVVDCVDSTDLTPFTDGGTAAPDDAAADARVAEDAEPDRGSVDAESSPIDSASMSDAADSASDSSSDSDADAGQCGFCNAPDAPFATLGCGALPLPLTGAGASSLEGAPVACCFAAIGPHVVIDPAGMVDRLDSSGVADPSIYACCTLVVAWMGAAGTGVPPDVDAACCHELGGPAIPGCSPWGPPVPPPMPLALLDDEIDRPQ